MKSILSSTLLLGAGLLVGPLPRQTTTPSTSTVTQKITTCLWFNHQAEEAVRFYLSIFKDSKILTETRWGEGGPMPAGTLMAATFQLEGQSFLALNGAPQIPFTEAVSLFVSCQTQREVDELWEKLSAGGEPGRCGWLKDKFGVSWQIIPDTLVEMLGDKDPRKARAVSAAMLQMGKLDIQRLKEAYDQP
jgi:predicted 3-demethylubiquinone-9 3-methyltransferase (glyoxalase superfamily)